MSTERPAHPGVVVFENAIDGSTKRVEATLVPEGVAYGKVDGRPVPVVRVLLTALDDDQRLMRSFADDGREVTRTLLTTGDAIAFSPE